MTNTVQSFMGRRLKEDRQVWVQIHTTPPPS